jgi:YD repeat-containing protein
MCWQSHDNTAKATPTNVRCIGRLSKTELTRRARKQFSTITSIGNYTSDAMGHYTGTYYDGQDHVIITLTHMQNLTFFSYDGRHNLRAIQDPLGCRKFFYYDENDNLKQVVDEREKNSYFFYNDKFQMIYRVNDESVWSCFEFNDDDGNLIRRIDDGGTTTYGYDANGQLNSITYPDNLGGESLTYNSRGDVISRVNRVIFQNFHTTTARMTNTIAPTNLKPWWL